MITFKDLKLSSSLINELEKNNFTHPTEIQQQAIPLLTQEKNIDFHGQAQTGTGKTLAFGLPLLEKINIENTSVQALVVAPTRELVLQICESVNTFAPALGIKVESIYGGVSIDRQFRALKKGGVHIIVGTPGRLNDHLRRGSLKLDSLTTLVLDEADIMLDMGFKEEVDEILTFAPRERQIWLFSATVKAGINEIKQKHMSNVVSVAASKSDVATSNTKQYVCVIPSHNRLDILRRFIDSELQFYGFVFCPTKAMTSDIGAKLTQYGYNAAALHGDMNQLQRNEVISKFKNKDYNILVCTDVAARGIDVSHVTHVINYCLPDDHESYIHRIGRTGRAGNEGTAITFITKKDLRKFSFIKRKFKLTVDPIEVPSYKKVLEAGFKKAQAYLGDLAKVNGQDDFGELGQYVDGLSAEQLKRIALNIAHQRFMKHMPEQKEIQCTPANKLALDDFQIKELLLPVGSDDQVKKGDVISFLTSSGVLEEDQIQKIRVIKRRTFVEVPASLVTSLINSLRYKKIGRRNIRMRVVQN